MNRLGFVAAQLMPKPGARQALARMVTVHDLPGSGWTVADERTWRTGIAGSATEWGKRARAAGSITAWRAFKLAARQGCSVQVTPLSSQSDALSAVEGIGDGLLSNLRSTVTVLSEKDVEIELFPGAARVWAHEQYTSGPAGDGVAKILAAAVGSHVIVVSTSGSLNWEWNMVTAIAHRQATLLAAA